MGQYRIAAGEEERERNSGAAMDRRDAQSGEEGRDRAQDDGFQRPGMFACCWHASQFLTFTNTGLIGGVVAFLYIRLHEQMNHDQYLNHI